MGSLIFAAGFLGHSLPRVTNGIEIYIRGIIALIVEMKTLGIKLFGRLVEQEIKKKR